MIDVRPVSVPWWIGPTTPYLELVVNAEGGTAKVAFLGSYGFAGMPSQPGREGDRRLVARFEGVLRTRTEPLQDDADEADLPFRVIGTPEFTPEDPERWHDESVRRWLDTGICPDPRMYESVDQQDGLHTYVLRGHDGTVFVEARSWTWEDLGEALWQMASDATRLSE